MIPTGCKPNNRQGDGLGIDYNNHTVDFGGMKITFFELFGYRKPNFMQEGLKRVIIGDLHMEER